MAKAKNASVSTGVVMKAIREAKGTKTLAELAADLGMEKSTLSQSVAKLRTTWKALRENGEVQDDFPAIKDGRGERAEGNGRNAQERAILDMLRSAGDAPVETETVTANDVGSIDTVIGDTAA